jgi:hypothetical protein
VRGENVRPRAARAPRPRSLRGAAANAEENGDDAGAGGGEADELAGADGGGVPRVALVGREEGEAGGGSHLHDRDGRWNVQ